MSEKASHVHTTSHTTTLGSLSTTGGKKQIFYVKGVDTSISKLSTTTTTTTSRVPNHDSSTIIASSSNDL